MKGDKGIIKWVLFALPILLVLFIFRDFVFFGRFYADGDTLFAIYTYFSYVVNDGALVTNNILSGFPVFVSPMTGWFYPISKFVSSLFDPLTAYKVISISNILLAYIFTYLYSKRINLGHYYAVFAGSIFIFSGELMQWSMSINNSNYFFILPAVLYLIEIANSRKGFYRYLFIIISGILLGLGWLSSHPQWVAYISAFVFVYLIYSIFSYNRAGLGVLIDSFLLLATTLIVGFPQIMAVLRWQATSVRATGVALSDVYLTAYLPQDVLRLFLPFLNIPFVPFGNSNLYVGILPLVLIIIGFACWRELKAVKMYWFFLATFAFCFVASWYYSPIAYLLHQLPVFSSFRAIPRIMFVGEFALAILSGFVLRYVCEMRPSNIIARASSILSKSSLLIALIGIVGTIVYFLRSIVIGLASEYFKARLYAGTSHLPLEHYLSVISSSVTEALRQFSIFDVQIVVLLLVTILVYLFFRSLSKLTTAWIPAIAILLIIANSALVYADHFDSISRSTLMEVPETVKFIKDRESNSPLPYRVFSLFPGFTTYDALSLKCGVNDGEESLKLQKELLLPNINMLYDIDVIGGYDNFMPDNVSRVLASVGSEQTATAGAISNLPIPLTDRIRMIESRKNMLRIMNVKYVISHYPLTDPDFIKVAKFEVGRCKTEVSVYELDGVWPRYFTHEGGINEALIPIYGYSNMSFEINTEATTTMFVGNAFLPDWSAYIDTIFTPIEREHFMYMSVLVPPGRHTVTFVYTEPVSLKHLW